jgi:hypothetical protein
MKWQDFLKLDLINLFSKLFHSWKNLRSQRLLIDL